MIKKPKTQNVKFKTFRGFTLSEMLIAIGIGVLIISASLTVYIISQKSFKSGSEKIELAQNARIALDKISRELRETNEIATVLPPTNDDPENPPANEIVFRDANYSQIRYIRYYISGNNLQRQVYHYYKDDPNVWVAYDTPGGSGWLAMNACDESYNGLYVQIGTFDDKPLYKNETRWLYWTNYYSMWQMNDELVPGYCAYLTTNPNLPGNPWASGGKTPMSPVPTVSASSASLNTQVDEESTIGNQISSIQFYGQSVIITINMTAQSGSDHLELTNQVSPRNL